nr:hypothetical protein Iba_contig173CG0010 [Ipomoea batatas]
MGNAPLRPSFSLSTQQRPTYKSGELRAESSSSAAVPTAARTNLSYEPPSSPSADLRSWFMKKRRLRMASSSGLLPLFFQETHGRAELRRHPLHSSLPA